MHPSLVVVDDGSFDRAPGQVPVLVLPGQRLIAADEDDGALSTEVNRRLARGDTRRLGRLVTTRDA